jgi:hypothetical protein
MPCQEQTETDPQYGATLMPNGKKLRHVRQPTRSSGCVPASVAIVANCSYEKASLVLFGDVRLRDAYVSTWAPIKKALRELRTRHDRRVRSVSCWDDVRKTSIVDCKPDKDGVSHIVVFSPKNGLIYDPLKAHPVPLNKIRRKPNTCLGVRPR